MSNELHHIRPLCPAHHLLMIPEPNVVNPANEWDRVMGRTCKCKRPGCNQHYSPGYGYFIVEQNIEHSKVTGVPSLRIHVNATQAICGDHDYAMFIESFHPVTNVQRFNCPEISCRTTCQVVADAPPAYWLGDDYFLARMTARKHSSYLRPGTMSSRQLRGF